MCCLWLNILLPAPLAPACWPGREQHTCIFPRNVRSSRSEFPRAWSLEPVTKWASLLWEGRRDQIGPRSGEPVCGSAVDGSCFRQPQRLPLWPSSFCNLHYRPEDGALDPGVRARGSDSFHNWTEGKSDPPELLGILYLLILLPTLPAEAHSHDWELSFWGKGNVGISFLWSQSSVPPELPCCQN